MTDRSATIEFRLARHSDLAAYAKLATFAVGEFERSTGLGENPEAMAATLARWPIWTLLQFSQFLGRPILQVHLATDGPRLVGTATLVLLRETGYIVSVATLPEYRGQGIASHLLERLHAETVRRHRRWVALDVESENESALRVYRRAGYREIARHAWFRGPRLPPSVGPTAAPAKAAELHEFVRAVNANRSPELRTALPATPRALSHLEFMFRGGRVERATWLRRATNGSVVGLRAYFTQATRTGVFLPISSTLSPTTEEFRPLCAAGTAWLAPRAPSVCLAVVPEPAALFGPLFEEMGLKPVVGTTTMARRLAEQGA
jgi:ribosomal protein S18 acetylase RimI-like enzyme